MQITNQAFKLPQPSGKVGLQQAFLGPLLVRVNGQLKSPQVVSLTTVRPNEWECEVPSSKLASPMKFQHLGDTQPNEPSLSDVDGRRGCRVGLALYHNVLKLAKFNRHRFNALYENRKAIIKHLSEFTRDRHLGLIKAEQPKSFEIMMKHMNAQGRRRVINGLQTQVNFVATQLKNNEAFLKYLYDCKAENDKTDEKRRKLIDECPVKFQWETKQRDEFIYKLNGCERYYTNQKVLSNIPQEQRLTLADLIEHPKYWPLYVL